MIFLVGRWIWHLSTLRRFDELVNKITACCGAQVVKVETVDTWIEQESEAPARKRKNQAVRFLKPDLSILSGHMAVRGTSGLQRGSSPPAKWRLNGGEARTMTTQGVEVTANRSNRRKRKVEEKLGQKINCICFNYWIYQSSMTYVYIGSRT
jgi:hypothetical protein